MSDLFQIREILRDSGHISHADFIDDLQEEINVAAFLLGMDQNRPCGIICRLVDVYRSCINNLLGVNDDQE